MVSGADEEMGAASKIVSDGDRRERILAAAERRFGAIGISRTSIADIARESKVSKRDIYHYWASKEELFSEISLSIFKKTLEFDLEDPDSLKITSLNELGRMLLRHSTNDRLVGLVRVAAEFARDYPALAIEADRARRDADTPFVRLFGRLFGKLAPEGADYRALSILFGRVSVEGSRYMFGHEKLGADASTAYIDGATTLFLYGFERLPSVPFPSDENDESLGDKIPPFVPPPDGRLSLEIIEDLMNKLLVEFCQRGVVAADLARVSKEVGISRSTLYRYIKSKEESLEEAVRANISEISGFPQEKYLNCQNLYDSILNLCGIILADTLSEPNRSLSRLLIEESNRYPSICRLYYDIRLRRVKIALLKIFRTFGLEWRGDIMVRAFYALATFGMKYFLSAEIVSEKERKMLAQDTARIFLSGAVETVRLTIADKARKSATSF